jgi:hypothetical protein
VGDDEAGPAVQIPPPYENGGAPPPAAPPAP